MYQVPPLIASKQPRASLKTLVSKQPPVKIPWVYLGVAITVVIFVVGMLLLSGPALVVNAGHALGEGTWTMPLPDPLRGLIEYGRYVWPEAATLKSATEGEALIIERSDLAIKLLESGLRVWPESAEMNNTLGEIYYQKEQPNLAVDYFQRAVKQEADLAVAHNNLGVALLSQSQPLEAIPHLLNAVSLDPVNPQAFINLGNAYLRAGDPNLAVLVYQQATDLDPELSSAWVVLGRTLLNLGKFNQAQQSFIKAIDGDPTRALALQGLGVAAVYQTPAENALVFLEATQKIQPTEAVTHLYLGLVLEALNKPGEAITQFEQAIELSEDPALLELANAHLYLLSRVSPTSMDKQGGELTENP